MEIELVIWFDNRSGVTHIAKRFDNNRCIHLTPKSVDTCEANLIKEMCKKVSDLYEGKH